MTTNSSDEYDQLAEKSFLEFRKRLLDISLRNKLINFAHPKKNNRYIRIVDEVPDLLFDHLVTNKKRFHFAPVPDPTEEPKDEKTVEFRQALEEARLSDPEYLKKLETTTESESNEDPVAAYKLERWLRNKVRGSLGKAPIPDVTVSLSEYAKSHGIDPSYDLPDSSSGDQKHEDSLLQTLYLEKELERRIKGVRDYHRLAQDERGINTLHLAIGFLEWFPHNSPNKAVLSPLILVPLSLEREAATARKQGEIKRCVLSSSEDEIAWNASLDAKLQADFSITLPEIGEEDTPESYFSKIESQVIGTKSWRIRRWASVCHLSFQKIALYNDLAPSKWQQVPYADGRLRDLLVGGGSGGGDPLYAEDYDIDELELRTSIDLLIRDADSSQHSAILDVLEGKNTVIEGPPGTGKSQTITNLIALAINKGKKVLFVAEKLAALKVVKKRLDDASFEAQNGRTRSIGDYCLEIHSTKTGKSQLIESIRQRDELSGQVASPREFGEQMDELWILRSKLKSYSAWLNSPAGQSGKTVHDLIWMEASSSKTMGSELTDLLSTTRFVRAELMGSEQLKRLSDLLSDYAQRKTLYSEGTKHELSWIKRTDLDRMDIDAMLEKCQDLTDSLSKIDSVKSKLSTYSGYSGPSDFDLTKCIQALQMSLENATISGIAKAFCSMPGAKRVATQSLDAVKKLPELIEAHQQHFDSEWLEVENRAVEIIDWVSASPLIPNSAADAINKQVELLEAAVHEIESSQLQIRSISQLLGIATEQQSLSLLGEVSQLNGTARDIPDEHLDFVASPICSPQKNSNWERVLNIGKGLVERREELESTVFTNKLPSEKDLRSASEKLEKTGLLGKLGSEYKAAKALFNSIWKGGDYEKTLQVETLNRCAQFQFDVEALKADTAWSLFPEPPASVLDVPFDAYNKSFNTWQNAHSDQGLASVLNYFSTTHLPAKAQFLSSIKRSPFPNLEATRTASRLLSLNAATTSFESASAAIRTKLEELKACLEERRIYGIRSDKCPAEVRLASSKTRELSETIILLRSFSQAAKISEAAIEDLSPRIEECIRAADTKELLTPYPRLLDGFLDKAPDTLQHQISATLEEPLALEKSLATLFREIESCAGGLPPGADVAHPLSSDVESATVKLQAACSKRQELANVMVAETSRQNALSEGVPERLLDTINAETHNRTQTRAAVKYVFARSVLENSRPNDPELKLLIGSTIDSWRHKFQSIDRKLRSLSAKLIASNLSSADIPAGNGYGRVADYTDKALLRHFYSKKRILLSLRKIIDRSIAALIAMKPCFMMSPQSVAEYLPRTRGLFDIIVIDEASQMKPEDALSAIARANQLVVVGDDKQLPPTNFFAASEDLEEEGEEEEKAESILEMAHQIYSPTRLLSWHYRSRHERLIQFSNTQFYRDNLTVFPTQNNQSKELGVHYIDAKGCYKDQRNPIEARRVANLAVDLMSQFDPNNPHKSKSIGVVTMNQQQRELIDQEIQTLVEESPRARAFVEHWDSEIESFFVRNLENVQGDERDIIIVSTLFGPPPTGGKPSNNFGPIAKRYGHRRLNVLFTRAKERLIVVSSIRPEDIKADQSKNIGPKVFKDYLLYARDGYISSHGSRSDADSDFEIAVGSALTAQGYDVVYQVGCIGYFIDLAVRLPDGRNFLGIECDGAAFHSSKSARDRDALRESQLRALGWNIHRIWSTDWFRDRTNEEKRLIEAVEQARIDFMAKNKIVPEEFTHHKQVEPAGITDILGRQSHLSS